MVPYITRWLKTRRKNYLSLVFSTFQKFSSSISFFNFIVKWHENLLEVQSALKFQLYIKKRLYQKLITRWNQAEINFFHKNTLKKSKKSQKPKKKKEKFKITSTIPDEIKKYYISTIIRRLLADYIQKMKNYKSECSEITKINQETNLDRILLGTEELKYPSRPKHPNILLSITDNDFTELIKTAERERSNWSHILSTLNFKIHSTYKLKFRN
jgi:hypothetical protein